MKNYRLLITPKLRTWHCLPEGKVPIAYKGIFKIKHKADGSMKRNNSENTIGYWISTQVAFKTS